MKLTEKLCAIMGELKPITKQKHSTGVAYAFRSIDEVVNAINPLLAKYQVFVTCEILSKSFEVFTTQKGTYEQRGFYAHVTARYWFQSGDEKIFSDMAAGSLDYSDKAETQAMSMALKYCYIQCFNITTADLKDPDGQSPTVETAPPKVQVPAKPPTHATISEDKFSWALLENGKWNGKFIDNDVIELTGKSGKVSQYKLEEIQKQAAENYLNSKTKK